MMARVRLDASHVSRSVTARREKTTRYIRVLNKLSEVRTFSSYSLRLRVVELTVREDLHGSCSLSIWWFGHWLERWSAIGRSGTALFLCRFLRWFSKRNGGEKRSARRSFDEAVSSVPVNRQDLTALFNSSNSETILIIFSLFITYLRSLFLHPSFLHPSFLHPFFSHEGFFQPSLPSFDSCIFGGPKECPLMLPLPGSVPGTCTLGLRVNFLTNVHACLLPGP